MNDKDPLSDSTVALLRAPLPGHDPRPGFESRLMANIHEAGAAKASHANDIENRILFGTALRTPRPSEGYLGLPSCFPSRPFGAACRFAAGGGRHGDFTDD